MTDQERQQYIQSVREGKVTLDGIEAEIFKDLEIATNVYQEKQQRLETLSGMVNTLRNELLSLSGQVMAHAKTLCQAEERRRLVANPPISMEEFGKKIGADKVEFVKNRN